MSRLKRIPLYPFLLGIYTILLLLSVNIQEVKPVAAIRAFVVMISLSILLVLFFYLLVKDWHRAAAMSSVVLIIFLSYGHIYGVLMNVQIASEFLGKHRYLLPPAVGLTLLGCRGVKRVREPTSITAALNLILLVAFIFPVSQILNYQLRVTSSKKEGVEDVLKDQPLSELLSNLAPQDDRGLPDIYYLILDAYARDDVLLEYFDLDNSPFLGALEEMGFYVGYCSQSNYSLTSLSLSSTLNMSYLDQLDIDTHTSDIEKLHPVAQSSAVRKTLESFAYKMVSFESGYFISEWQDADLYLSYSDVVREPLTGLNSFESMFLYTTGGRALFDFQHHFSAEVRLFLNHAYNEHREQILYILEELGNLPNIDGPKFVVAHIVSPHEPFVFGPKGELVTQTETFSLKQDIFWTDKSDYVAGYRDQVLYLNSRVKDLVREILAQSRTPPIIIVQADHGPLGGETTSDRARMSILNAYYLPDGGDQLLYPSISPVNTFRVIFNHYFGGDIALLEDVARISQYGDPFDLQVIPEVRPTCIE